MNKIIILLLMLTVFSYCKDKSNVEAKGNQTSDSSSNSKIEKYEQTLYIDARGGLRMREEPNANAKVVILIPEREEVQAIQRTKESIAIDGKKDHWVKVKFKEHTGWVFGGYLNTSRPLKCMKLTEGNLEQFEGGCLGVGCKEDYGEYQVQFNKDHTTYIVHDVRDQYKAGLWKVEDEKIIVDFKIEEYDRCHTGCQSLDGEEASKCYEDCDPKIMKKYGKMKTEIDVQYKFFLKGDSFYSTASGEDKNPIPGKAVYKYHNAHSEPKKYGCMHYFKGEGEEE